MSSDVPALAHATRGTTANGFPFVALPPAGGARATAVVVAYHGADPPRSEEALAAAVPMSELPAWRLYLGMPLFGNRKPEGGGEEIMRRGAEDSVNLVFAPSIGGALAELSGAIEDLRAELRIGAELPAGIFGFSQGGAAALLAVSRGQLPVKAAATFGAAVDFPVLVDGLASFYGIAYQWNDQRRALAEELSAINRARELAASGAAILLAVGSNDPYPMREPNERLAAAIQEAGGTAEARIVPDLAHAFVDEPGEAPAPQGPRARAVDQLATSWFRKHLA